jgi:mRNA-degrading endonuclease RelE of RelBE toxin-antitoxin system
VSAETVHQVSEIVARGLNLPLMEFIETHYFRREAARAISEDELFYVQLALSERPTLGVVIPGSGGLRKMRWVGSGRGKSGGTRIIYYYAISRDIILLLDVFLKSEKADLTRSEIRNLRRFMKEELLE